LIRIGLVIIIAAIVVSISVANYFYYFEQPNLISSESGSPIKVGNVMYDVMYEGTYNGDEKKRPEYTYFKILIIAENLNSQPTRMHGGQFYLMDDDEKKIRPDYGAFSDMDLLETELEPNKQVTWTTQFDIEFDEDARYRIGILPIKAQESKDIGIICVKNC